MEIETVKRLNDFLQMEWDYGHMEEITEKYFIHCLSTYIFDCYHTTVTDMVHCLKSIQKHFPEYYIFAMEGFLVGSHDT